MSDRFASAAMMAFALMFAGWPAYGQAPLRVVRERVLAIDMRIDPQAIVAAGGTGPAGLAWRTPIRTRFPQGGGMDGIRVHVVLDAALGAGQTLRVLDAAGSVIDAVSGNAAAAPRELWSRVVPDGAAIVELTRSAAGAAPGATISYAYRVIPTEQQAISGENQIMSLA